LLALGVLAHERKKKLTASDDHNITISSAKKRVGIFFAHVMHFPCPSSSHLPT
jgi:hypothetical protein